MSEMKQCRKCGEVKELDNFHKDKTAKDGRSYHCKACARQRASAHYYQHQEQKKEYASSYRKNNLGKYREYMRLYAEEHREELRVYRYDYYRSHKEKWLLVDRAKKRHWERAYRARRPEILSAIRTRRKEKRRLEESARNARKKGNGGRGITVTDVEKMREQQGSLCAYCKRDTRDIEVGESLDHVIPIQKGGLHDPDNAVLCCPVCNSSKQDKTPEEWVDRWYERVDE